MRTTNDIDFGNNLEAYLDSVAQDGEPLIIHRPNNESVVIMPIEEYNALKNSGIPYALERIGNISKREHPRQIFLYFSLVHFPTCTELKTGSWKCVL